MNKALRATFFISFAFLFVCVTNGIWFGDSRWFWMAIMPGAVFALLLLLAPLYWEA